MTKPATATTPNAHTRKAMPTAAALQPGALYVDAPSQIAHGLAGQSPCDAAGELVPGLAGHVRCRSTPGIQTIATITEI